MPEFAVKTPPQHTSWADMLDVWRAADEIEVFSEAWNFDHFYPLHPPLDGRCMEGWTTLAALTQATSRIRVGSMVNGMHYRHPAVTANMAASLDIISGGRFNLGLGAGWFEPESQAYGIPLGTLKERMDRFDEGVEVIHRLLTQESTTFTGAYYQLADARCEPKPLQQPRPPIVIGGKGEKRTLRTVARYADYWDAMFHDEPGSWARLNDILLSHCQAVGRDPSAIRRSIHLRWAADGDPGALADEAMRFTEAGVDTIIFSMQAPYSASALEPMARALQAASS
ncbi:MAG: LLM class F420-dependent oxidoreductase [Acidimicrobiia bacterium]|nr:LLM class F420-dependent oxidoreductase [Acidimicrobiia bacterium]